MLWRFVIEKFGLQPFSRDEIASIHTLVLEILEETPLWDVTGAYKSIGNTSTSLDRASGWAYASWVYGHLLRAGQLRCASLDTWTRHGEAPPSWLTRATRDREWWNLHDDDALSLISDISRWSWGTADASVQLVQTPDFDPNHAMEILVPFAGSQPPLGADVLYKAEQKRQSVLDSSHLNVWHIFPKQPEQE